MQNLFRLIFPNLHLTVMGTVKIPSLIRSENSSLGGNNYYKPEFRCCEHVDRRGKQSSNVLNPEGQMHSFQYLPRAGGWAGGEAGGLETPARRGQAAGSSGEQPRGGVRRPASGALPLATPQFLLQALRGSCMNHRVISTGT